ncbi:MAG: TlpA disulfide reductase family protein [Phaeodactylibacter sp.]|uniref:TlpA disulfide reductase family protein n=1 Tax=Phaeodactylibacter sp. TaxID=1940289 RepID=UPI0032EABB0A
MIKYESAYTMKISMLFAAFMLIAGCGAAEDQGAGDRHSGQQTAAFSVSYPVADSTLSGIPVYPKFDNIAPLLAQNNDTTYVVNFWATWCKPCVQELPYFIEMSEKYARQPVRILLVSLDFPAQLQSRLVPFVEERNIKPLVAVLLDGKYNDWIDRVSPEWTGAIPATLIYKGTNRHFVGEAVHSLEELEQALNTIYQP